MPSMDTPPGILVRRQSSAPCLTWSLIGMPSGRASDFDGFDGPDTVTGQPRAVCSAISPQRIHNTRSSSSSLSRSTLAAITCICTGTRFLLSSVRLGLTYPCSSLVTGSKSHKLVTSDVSRILWFYYNDPVCSSHLSWTPFSSSTDLRQPSSSSALETNSSLSPSTSLTG